MKSKLISAIMLAALILTLPLSVTSCGYNDTPIPKYEYPRYLTTYTTFRDFVAGDYYFTDEQQIRAFIDMINSCEFKEDEIGELTHDEYMRDYIYIDCTPDNREDFGFYLHISGDHLILADEFLSGFGAKGESYTVYKIKGADPAIIEPLYPPEHGICPRPEP